MTDPAIAKQLVEAIIADTPDHAEGTRPIHTVGIGVEGHFQALNVAANYCTAEHFRGHKVPVSVRFSNGSGSPVERDGVSDVRGMATRFHLADGQATDLLAMTLGEFFVPDIPSFLEFTTAALPKPAKRETPWAKLKDMLQLKLPLPDPMPWEDATNTEGLIDYANRHGFAQLSVTQVGTIGAPVSYARAAYHAVNTFIVTDPNGKKRYVRFNWQPVAGVLNRDSTAPIVNQYLHQEMRDRLAHWPARFILDMVIAEAWDDVADPTKPWPNRRTKISMGSLTLTKVAEDQKEAAEKIAFNPCRLVPGIEMSEDPILQARKEAYEYSRKLRGGTGCPFFGGSADAT
ncbi:MAG: catalase [Pseudomonadota bacterium]